MLTDPALSSRLRPASSAPGSVLAADASDPLAGFRARFDVPDDRVYLDGNSLGVLPAATRERMARAVTQEWGQGLVGSWNAHDWIGAPARVGDKIARLIGAAPGEVLVADSTSVNLFKLLVAALERWRGRPGGRRTILSEPGDFPTDLYVAQGVTRVMPDFRLRLAPAEAIVESIDDDTAVVLLTHVHYKSGRRLDMARLTAAAHARGALVLWDLSHSVGAIEVDLDGCAADLAVGCGYKYLNGGPGAPGFLFVASRLQPELQTPLTGWMGHARPFDFADDYAPKTGVERFGCGTPPMLSLIALESGVDLMLKADPQAIARKAEALSAAFVAEVEARCGGYGLTLASPRTFGQRGSHVAFAHDRAHAVCRALIDLGVIGDFRAPDVIRFGFTPLYTRFVDAWIAARALSDVLATAAWDHPRYEARDRVT